jgi:hypothetical protein
MGRQPFERFQPGDATKIRASGVYGKGIASYFNDGGTDLAPRCTGTGTPSASRPRRSRSTAWRSSSTTTGTTSSQFDRRQPFQGHEHQLPGGDAYGTGDYALVNLTYKPIDHLLLGGELMYGRRKDNYGATGEDTRVQFSLRYTYGAKVVGRR